MNPNTNPKGEAKLRAEQNPQLAQGNRCLYREPRNWDSRRHVWIPHPKETTVQKEVVTIRQWCDICGAFRSRTIDRNGKMSAWTVVLPVEGR